MPDPMPALPTSAPVPTITCLDPRSESSSNALLGDWPDRKLSHVARPELHSYPLANARARAVVYGGGGYTQLMYDKEGIEVALWLASHGIEAHVLVHRLPGTDDNQGGVHPFDIARQDGLAALDHLATQSDLPLLHVGLSSGGHLAGVMACAGHDLTAKGVLIAYAPLSTNHKDHKFPAGKPDFPPVQKQAFYDAYPIGLEVHPEGVPQIPTFLAYALTDRSVAVENALRFTAMASKRELDVDLHVFGQAPHGFALRDRAGSHAAWTGLAQAWFDRVLSS